MEIMEGYMTVAEASKIKRCARLTIYNWIRAGKVNVVEISGRKFIVKDEKFETARSEKRNNYLAERMAVLEAKVEQLSKAVAKGK
jgi:excisionase family DNA binding protein